MDGVNPIGRSASLAGLAQLLGPSAGAADDGADVAPALSEAAGVLAGMDLALAQQTVTYRAFKVGAAGVLQLITDGLQAGAHVDARV